MRSASAQAEAWRSGATERAGGDGELEMIRLGGFIVTGEIMSKQIAPHWRWRKHSGGAVMWRFEAPPMLILVFGLFFLSGFSALVYQTAWQRMLGPFAGSDAVATTMIVGAFLFGLGIGSLVAASFADRLSSGSALQAFAFCEISVGIFACFSRTVFYDLFLHEFSALAGAPLTSGAIILLALLPPTALMGMSLPLLARIVVDTIEGAPTRIGWLYGLNTLGAAAGAFITGWILIGTLGFAVTVYAAATINFLIGGAGLLASYNISSSRASGSLGQIRIAHGSDGETRHRLLAWSLMVFVSGFLIISLEIVWFRILGTLMRTDSYAFSSILGVFLLGDGLGVIVGAGLAPGLAHPRRVFQLLQGGMGLYALISLATAFTIDVHSHLRMFQVDRGLTFNLVAITLPIVLPPAFLLGMSFPVTQRAIQDDPGMVGRRVGLVQLCNILGNTAGAVVTGLVLLQWFGTAPTLRLIGVGSLAFVLMAFVESRRWQKDCALTLALVALIAIFPSNAAFWSALHGTTSEGAIVSEDCTGIAVLRLAGSRIQDTDQYGSDTPHDTLYVAGHPQSRVPFLSVHGALGILGAMLHPNPQDIFIIGQGTGGTPIAAGVNPNTRTIRVVDIVAPVFDVMQRAAVRSGDDIMHRPLRDYYGDPRYTRTVMDARHVLLSEEKRYDIIEADAVYPTTALAGQLYSTDFFRLALHRLKPGGYVVQWVPTGRTLASFLRVFPYVVTIGGWVAIGSAGPINISNELLKTEMAGMAGDYLTKMGWNRKDVAGWLISEKLQSWGPDSPREDRDVNTDIFPKDEFRGGRPFFLTLHAAIASLRDVIGLYKTNCRTGSDLPVCQH